MWDVGGFCLNTVDLSKHFMIRLHLGTGRRRASEHAMHLTHLHTDCNPVANACNLLLIKYNKHCMYANDGTSYLLVL